MTEGRSYYDQQTSDRRLGGQAVCAVFFTMWISANSIALTAPLVVTASGAPALRVLIEQQDDSAYMGGMAPAIQRAATALREELELQLGRPLSQCAPPGPRQGFVLVDGMGPDQPSVPTASIAGIELLLPLLESERPAVRDSAAYLLGEIGPDAAPAAALLEGKELHRPVWFTHALGRIACQPYRISDPLAVLPVPARTRLGLPEIDGTRISRNEQLRIAAALLKQPELAWPDQLFSSWLQNQNQAKDEPAVAASVLALAGVVADERRAVRSRVDVASLLGYVGRAAEPAAAALLGAMQAAMKLGDNELSYTSALALLRIGGPSGAQGAAQLIGRHWIELRSAQRELCALGVDAKPLVGPLIAVLKSNKWADAESAAMVLGCIGSNGATTALLEALDHPSWLVQTAAATALGKPGLSDENTRTRLAQVAQSHWSGNVRAAAAPIAVPADGGVPLATNDNSEKLETITLECFHRCFVDHSNGTCAGENIRDGRYALDALGAFSVQWQRARRNPIPKKFPIAVAEDQRLDYGTNTFLRVSDGWLFGTDRWHYDGQAEFVSDAGKLSPIGEWSDDAVAILETPHFGVVLLGQSILGIGNTGVLVRLMRKADGLWTALPVTTLPSEPWAWSFAPDGTLLVADTLNAVAVHRDGHIENLRCPADLEIAGEKKIPETLLALAARGAQSVTMRAKAASKALPEMQTLIKELSANLRRAEPMTNVERSAAKTASPAILHSQLSETYAELGQNYSSLGRHREALAAFEAAQRHDSDSEKYRLDIAGELFTSQRYRESDAAFDRVLTVSRTSNDLRSVAFQRLAAARYVEALKLLDTIKAKELGTEDRAYSAAHLVLAALAEGRDADKSLQQLAYAPHHDNLFWPEPLVEMLRGKLTEAQLVGHVIGDDARRDFDRLCEALYFRGLQLEIAGEMEAARQHYKAAISTRVVDFLEYHAAERGLARLSRRSVSKSAASR